MKRSLAHLPTTVLAAAAIALVAGAAPAQALDSCTVGTPCLPQNATFQSNMPISGNAGFVGNVFGSGTLFGTNGNDDTNTDPSDTSGVLGVYFGSARGSGVVGRVTNTAANAAGVFGRHQSQTPGALAAGVRGESSATGTAGIGVLGVQGGSGVGVLGFTPSGVGLAGSGGQVGVLGVSPAGFAGLFAGNVHVLGTLSKSAGAFRIDHPLDPAHKYLQHSFVESPQMKNVYDGLVRTNRQGFANVRLPAYFQALNRDFRYQLTVHGRSFAQALVWREIANNRFTIRTNRPGVKVSWQVTGIRKDPYANAHRIQPELAKPADERGLYLYPELYGKPRSQSILQVPAAVRQARAYRG